MSIPGTSASAATPELRATSAGPSAELDDPQPQEREPTEHADVDQGDREQDQREPRLDRERDPDRAAPPGTPVGGEVGPGTVGRRPGGQGEGHRDGGEQHRRGPVAGLLEQDPAADRDDGEAEAAQEPERGVVPFRMPEGVDPDRVRQGPEGRLGAGEREIHRGEHERRPGQAEGDERERGGDPGDPERPGSTQADVGEVAPHGDRDREDERARGGDEADLGRREATIREDHRDERVEGPEHGAAEQEQEADGSHPVDGRPSGGSRIDVPDSEP
jgi:hypothetical protein